MKPEYAKNEVYSLIASWAESCGIEIRYKERETGETKVAYTRPEVYGPSYIQMYTNKELYIPIGKQLYCHYTANDDYFEWVGASNALAHEMAHQLFTTVSCEPFAKLFNLKPENANEKMVDNEDACDAFGNFLFTLAERIVNGFGAAE